MKKMKTLASVAFLLFAVLSQKSRAQTSAPWPTKTRMGVIYAVFGGEKYKAITNNSTAFGGEIAILKGEWRFANLIGRVRGLYISGEEDFLDGATPITASYVLFATEPGLGIHWNLMPFKPPGFRTYLSALGIMSYDHIRFDKDADINTINRSDTAIGFGYELGAGVEWNIKTKQSYFQVYGEIQYRNVQTDLAGQSGFQLTGLQMVGGLGW